SRERTTHPQRFIIGVCKYGHQPRSRHDFFLTFRCCGPITVRNFPAVVQSRMRVKICGIRSVDEAEGVIEAGADALGFHVQLEHSRCPVPAATASAIISKLPPFISIPLSTSD